jgi:outer membrane protein assembly factor BamA
MKKTLLFVLISLLAISAFSQETGKEKDKVKEKKIKTGWNVGLLPTITYDSDLGLQYGGLIDLYQYGKGDIFPNYYHKFYLEVSRFTKGSGIYRFNYDSEHLIPGIRFSTDVAYLPDEAYDFYGFNGYNSVINKGYIDKSSWDGFYYKSRMFYKQKRALLRWKNDFSGKLIGDKILWNAGFSLQKFTIDSINVAKMNKGSKKEALDFVTQTPGLYELYQIWNLIPTEDAKGGLINTLKIGITYDSRDNRPNPMKGIWTEMGIETSQEFLGSAATFGKFYFTHRQYFTLIPNDLGFAYRLGYQQTIFGKVPYYYQSQVIVSALRGASSEGLGGSKSLRGIWRNRVVGDGIFYGNAELRWKAARFVFLKQNWYMGINGFADFGMVTDNISFTKPSNYSITTSNKVIDINKLKNTAFYSDIKSEDFFKSGSDEMHLSAGLGLRFAMNENFIIAIDLGKAFKDQDGGMGFYMGLNYLF